ncbi:MAG: 5'-nucleotidase C-terminal domain-containing protein [Chloroflexi bacterium]|nr:5'-nucleotidase C-terminal domain-containing protein [Chloroflexota bacterium]
MDDKTTVTQAYYNGRQVGRADIVYNTVSGAVTITWNALATAAAAPNPDVDALINTYATDPEYLALINQPIGYTAVDLPRDYNGDNMMGDFVDDAIYNYLNNDDTTTNDIDMFFNNAGGIRTDWCSIEDPLNPGTYIWSSTAADCKPGIYTHDPMLLTYGNMFNILPFGNATVVGTMTGAQILDLLDQSATLFKGAIQPSGIRYKFYRYQDAGTTYAWGAYDACVVNRVTHLCDPLDVNKTYRVGTNEFLAPAGQDGYLPFKYLTNLSYWGDMLDAVNAYVSTANGTPVTAYKGPNKDGLLDGRITRVGDDAGGAIIPVTILHHNDSHGNLVKGTYVGYDQLATIINQERAHNPDRTILLNGGDDIQGDALSYYFKTAAQGMTSDGTPLPAALSINPNIAVLNQMGYTALVLGNHEFNFGPTVFDTTFLQAKFPILGANLSDSGAYGIAKLSDMSASAADAIAAGKVPVHDDITVNLPSGDPNNPIWVAILGLTNPRVPNYELPSNIPGLTFSDPIQTAKDLVPDLRANNDVVVALTHIGFTSDPNSIDYDPWVDTNLASEVSGIDAIIGAHSHTNPKYGDGEYKYLPAIIGSPADQPVIVNQAYRYNNTLGEVVLGLLPKAGGGFEVVTRAGKYISVTMDTPQDPAIDAIVDPYLGLLAAYNNTVLGETTVPIDALDAFTQETNAANLQADASVYELEQHDIIPDVHISGAMTNKKVANSATVATPYTLKVSDMFSLMPYENSLVMLRMNGPQIKAVLERGYRNYWYYKNVPDGYGGYSHYTTCMLDTNSAGKITYSDDPAVPPNGNNVVSFTIDGKAVDFNDAETYYNVSTVNYLAAGSCNFNDNGVSLWPLDQIENDTQFYVRDAVIDYIKAQTEPIAPAIEGRLEFLLQAFRYFFLPILIK